MRTQLPANSSSRRRKGFSLLEIMMVIAAISCVAAIGIVGITSASSASKSTKLRGDVATLNAAVRAYQLNGGSLTGVTTPEAVLEKLKSKADAASALKMASVRGSMIDPRLSGVEVSERGPERAVWIASKERFAVTNSGRGYSEFTLNEEAGPAATEARKNMMTLGSADRWVWDFTDSTPAVAALVSPDVGGISDPAAPANPDSAIRLQAPIFTTPGALYDLSAYSPTLPVRLRDPNVSGAGQIYYSVNNGPWIGWSGTPLQLAPSAETVVRAFIAPMNPDEYEQSDITSATYETIAFSGVTDGSFTKPKGDSGLMTNLSGNESNSLFTFGDPAVDVGMVKPNSLEFTGASFSNIAPDQEFELGTLSYYNGTTYSGTNATSVTLDIGLNFSSPLASEQASFEFKLLSTPNNGVNADDDADFVYIPKVTSKFSTIIKGQKFYLVLSFGAHDAGGFTTIDTFHAHENKTLTGKIYGRFTLTPP